MEDIKYKIKLKKESNKGNVSIDNCLISDGRMVTRHNNPADSFKIWNEKKAKGENVWYKRGMVVEEFKGESSKDILNHIEEELKTMKEKLKGNMEVSWEVTKC